MTRQEIRAVVLGVFRTNLNVAAVYNDTWRGSRGSTLPARFDAYGQPRPSRAELHARAIRSHAQEARRSALSSVHIYALLYNATMTSVQWDDHPMHVDIMVIAQWEVAPRSTLSRRRVFFDIAGRKYDIEGELASTVIDAYPQAIREELHGWINNFAARPAPDWVPTSSYARETRPWPVPEEEQVEEEEEGPPEPAFYDPFPHRKFEW